MASPVSTLLVGKKRAVLAKGTVLEIVNDLEALVTTMPLDLFLALSNKATIITKVEDVSRGQLAAYALDVAAKELVARVSKFTDPKVNLILMDSTEDLYKDIQTASIAEYLGLAAYTQRMFTEYWHYFSNDLVSPADITALCKV